VDRNVVKSTALSVLICGGLFVEEPWLVMVSAEDPRSEKIDLGAPGLSKRVSDIPAEELGGKLTDIGQKVSDSFAPAIAQQVAETDILFIQKAIEIYMAEKTPLDEVVSWSNPATGHWGDVRSDAQTGDAKSAVIYSINLGYVNVATSASFSK